jgi:hypothetical protein
MENVFTAAVELHQTGQLVPAARLYRQVLVREPDNAGALHLYGVLVHQQRHPWRDGADRPGRRAVARFSVLRG